MAFSFLTSVNVKSNGFTFRKYESEILATDSFSCLTVTFRESETY